jgi:hypothetical protein
MVDGVVVFFLAFISYFLSFFHFLPLSSLFAFYFLFTGFISVHFDFGGGQNLKVIV